MKGNMLLTLLFLVLMACAAPSRQEEGPPEGARELPPEIDKWIGHMLMVGFRGTRLDDDDPFLQQIRGLHLGGTVLFDYDVPSGRPLRNIEDARQVRQLTRALQDASAHPLLIAIDQEGGRVARLKPRQGFPETLSQQALGGLDDEESTRGQARAVAELLLDLGVNVNFAPVLDLNLHPQNPIIGAYERSYSEDPDVVVRHGRWTIDEFHRLGLLAAVKHFPGHGSSRQDSHLGLPDVTPYWQRVELSPFARLIEEGRPDLVMTAHLYHSEWDEELPATLSRRVIEGILRERLGFEGAVVSDDLQMGAIAQRFDLQDTLLKAVEAGLDILVFSNNSPAGYDPQIASKAHAALRQLVEDGRISPQRIRLSYERVRSLQSRLPPID